MGRDALHELEFRRCSVVAQHGHAGGLALAHVHVAPRVVGADGGPALALLAGRLEGQETEGFPETVFGEVEDAHLGPQLVDEQQAVGVGGVQQQVARPAARRYGQAERGRFPPVVAVGHQYAHPVVTQIGHVETTAFLVVSTAVDVRGVLLFAGTATREF